MNNCCQPEKNKPFSEINTCPINGKKGKKVSLNTLKSLLKPPALMRLNSKINHYFCESQDCEIVYFSEENQTYSSPKSFVGNHKHIKTAYNINDLKVPVSQKEPAENVPLCYCFDWTRAKIKERLISQEESPVTDIRQHIQAQRCGCEFNNPEGKCCLKNVTEYINSVLGHTS
ncbi:hypothetical protein VKI22_16325 [Cyanobacterium aponinum UTEX 3221]|uniref:hypothetical protein n=1 Tax=Cyanobacterium aponinum TaxID=379064 RepID=UPI002B4BD6EC|nr:hypothetical protein [Cyanobacterium aponinum]WRL38166.1 hypothetical protein VKI22_16325 [Cyanobacterium aponinum UTEX 3221]